MTKYKITYSERIDYEPVEVEADSIEDAVEKFAEIKLTLDSGSSETLYGYVENVDNEDDSRTYMKGATYNTNDFDELMGLI